MIINIRGTSGSGKTHLVRSVMEHCGGGRSFTFPGSRKVTGYVAGKKDKEVLVVGSYENTCGGCDGIKTQDEVCDLVRRFATTNCDVLFEGLLISHLFERYAQLAEQLGKDNFLFAFLDTPLEVCLERVNQRRAARGKTEPVNPKNTIQKWHDSRRTADKFVARGLRVEWLEYQVAAKQVLFLLGKP